MTPAANTLLPLILMALGLVKIVLSFLVPDRKKATIAMGLGVLVVVVGIVNLGSQSFQRFRWNQRMQQIQRERQADLDELQRRIKEPPQTGTNPAGANRPTSTAPARPANPTNP